MTKAGIKAVIELVVSRNIFVQNELYLESAVDAKVIVIEKTTSDLIIS